MKNLSEVAVSGAEMLQQEVANLSTNKIKITIRIDNLPIKMFDGEECETVPVGDGVIYKVKTIDFENSGEIELRSETASVNKTEMDHDTK